MLVSAPGMARPWTLILQAGQFLLKGGPFRTARLSTLIAQDAQDHVLAPVGFFEQRCEPLEFSMALGRELALNTELVFLVETRFASARMTASCQNCTHYFRLTPIPKHPVTSRRRRREHGASASG